MAEQIQGIKRRIKSIGTTERITNAMKLVSASKLRKAKARFEHSQQFLESVMESISEIFDTNRYNIPHEFLMGDREVKTTCFLLITGSNGLCGSFNGNVIRETERLIHQCENKVKVVTVGSKGRERFERLKYDVIITHDEPADSITYEETKSIVHPLLDMYKKGEIDEIIIVYTSYINTLKQEVIHERILPVDMNFHHPSSNMAINIDYSPSPEDVYSYLVNKYFELRLYSAAIESATCEHAARRQAMETASDSATDMLSTLRTEYNRARQEMITDEIIEIVSGSEAQG